MNKDLEYMRLAMDLAALAAGMTSPNPMVGSVVVKDDMVVGQGYHAKAGFPHAEIVALREAGERAKEAVLYVTLEPCCHYGRTGPCVEAIIKAGISKVVVAMKDPNPKVAGKGMAILQEAGIEVSCGVLEEDANKLNEVFLKYITTGMPFVVMKAAMSLDGKIATRTGNSKWITGPEAREYGHQLRNIYDAILVGINTVLADDPFLTTRLPQGGRNPLRVVLDSMARTPVKSNIIKSCTDVPTIIVATDQAPLNNIQLLREAGAEVMIVPSGLRNRVDIIYLLKKLAEREITSILIEGGGQVNGSALEAKVVDKVSWFIAPMLIGGQDAFGPIAGLGIDAISEAAVLEEIKVCNIGKDVLLEGYISKK